MTIDYKSTVFLPKTSFGMRANLPQKEPERLKKWQEDDLFGQMGAAREGQKKFTLHDGPPYANGQIHLGTALNKILKDVIVRAKHMAGFDAPYIPGWDCHGLPIEWKVEEQYRKQGKRKEEVPVQQFRKDCRAFAAKWVDVQREGFKRLGVFGDWENPYITMSNDCLLYTSDAADD